jgi:pyocin large subunit-like protein
VRAPRLLLCLWLLPLAVLAGGPGFRTRTQLEEHYQKHGAEFGQISKEEYLRLAQALRDAPVGGSILEATQPDGVISRFDKSHGYFGAYDRDGTIRTFFIPVDGERYFRRQARRNH